jgi:hypothetical protein
MLQSGGDLWGDEKRSGLLGAQGALRDLTRRGCLNEANAVSAMSFATRAGREHHSGVGHAVPTAPV